MKIALICSSCLLFSVSLVFASVEPALIYDGSQIPTIEIYQMENLKKDLREQLQFVDFGRVKQRHTKIKFVKFKNNTNHIVTCRGATFTGEGFGYTVENFAVEPGETTAMKVSFYANPASAVGRKTGKLEIRYAHDEPGEEDLFNIQMRAHIYR
ncbi:hypothetical protein [Bdellovibrio sp. KM01]|uniref:hypothetical protein n=1 Tax=Bdellovibrio sp. KM01 TaxID=2748865 RepID=UPI0015EA116A|nr:hypothetical protein [Bdellovibrio sp. KM01]QLY24498.1 hypothetical protein HW988_13670 [Bdellovibrio sp. KM01]